MRRAVKVPLLPALALFLLLLLGVPEPPRPLRTWDVLAVAVRKTAIPVPSLRGPAMRRFSLTPDDVTRIRRELDAFGERVRRGTSGLLEIRTRLVLVDGPLTSLSGPGPYWLEPEDVFPLLSGAAEVRDADTVLVFVKIGEDDGPAVPVRQLGGARGGDRGPGGACFAGITFRPRWLEGNGTVALHEWLHGLRWVLSEVAGFPDDAIPDPDEGRAASSRYPGAPGGDGPFADWILSHRLTREMIRAADARAGPARADGYLRDWTVNGRPRLHRFRTVTLPPGTRRATALLPPGARRLLVETDRPIRVELGGEPPVPVRTRAFLPARGRRVTVSPAVGGAPIRFRMKAL